MTLAAPRSRGFSLLEVIVTVAIFAMLFAVLMGGWFQALNAQSRLADTARQVQQQQHFSSAIRQLLAESLSPLPDRGVVFAGHTDGFSVETTASMAPGLGAAALPVTLRFEKKNDTSLLRIMHPGHAAVAFPWRFSVASVRYLDSQLQSHDSWPPASAAIGGGSSGGSSGGGGGRMAFLPLPALVQLSVQFEGQARPMVLLLAPRNSAVPLLEPTSPIPFTPN
jgi:prepilin-type N-terminal cleavage/methylation domain-containing protein